MTRAPEGPPNVYYGGQAVMEGVMIRGPEHMAVAVRHPKGHLVTHSEPLGGLYTGRARTIPLLRGVIVLWETMALGMRALNFSSRIVFMPLVAGIAYEILRIGARFGGNVFVHAMFVPNIALQGLTTKVPDDSQIEVAIASFTAVLNHAGLAATTHLAEHTEALREAPPLD